MCFGTDAIFLLLLLLLLGILLLVAVVDADADADEAKSYSSSSGRLLSVSCDDLVPDGCCFRLRGGRIIFPSCRAAD